MHHIAYTAECKMGQFFNGLIMNSPCGYEEYLFYCHTAGSLFFLTEIAYNDRMFSGNRISCKLYIFKQKVGKIYDSNIP